MSNMAIGFMGILRGMKNGTLSLRNLHLMVLECDENHLECLGRAPSEVAQLCGCSGEGIDHSKSVSLYDLTIEGVEIWTEFLRKYQKLKATGKVVHLIPNQFGEFMSFEDITKMFVAEGWRVHTVNGKWLEEPQLA